ncbi:DUF6058 family natural product biosynthesis protein [Streptomyces sp. NPDC056165]|uniref:DUF6058 family natural product biosynthesis protein n=1 Tax=Streptomyces sp. NPDC056165 TaxID=3345733 RepID=UPI0035E302BF
MSETDLKQQLAERFREVNGDHPMTDADDVYVSAQFVALEELCAVHGRDADAVRRLMLGQYLPLPGYLRSDGAEMVPADLFALADESGGVELLEAWFTAHWADPITGKAEWNAYLSYLSGQYVCLHSVTPAAIQRKDYLTTAISASENVDSIGFVSTPSLPYSPRPRPQDTTPSNSSSKPPISELWTMLATQHGS